jgi:multiple sugar transport system substrate-binding protein
MSDNRQHPPSKEEKLSRRDMLKLAAGSTAGAALTALGVSTFRPSAAVRAAQAAEPITLVYHTRDATDEAYARAVLEQVFSPNYPNITVELDITPNADFHNKLNTLAAGGQLGDGFSNFINGIVRPFAAAGVAVDMQPLVDADPEFSLDQYFASGLGPLQWRDMLIGLPTGGHAGDANLYTNITEFEAKGLPLPDWDWTYEGEFLETMTAATDSQAFGYSFHYWPVAPFIYLRSWGADWLTSGDENTPRFNSEAGEAAMRFFHSLVYEHHVAPSPVEVIGESARMFANQLTRSFSHGIWYRFTGRQTIGDTFEWHSFSMPSGPAGHDTFVGLDTTQINARSQNLDAAYQWAKALASYEGGLVGAQISFPPSFVIRCWDDPLLADDPDLQVMRRWWEEANPLTLPDNARVLEYWDVFAQSMDALMLDSGNFDTNYQAMITALEAVIAKPSL